MSIAGAKTSTWVPQFQTADRCLARADSASIVTSKKEPDLFKSNRKFFTFDERELSQIGDTRQHLWDWGQKLAVPTYNRVWICKGYQECKNKIQKFVSFLMPVGFFPPLCILNLGADFDTWLMAAHVSGPCYLISIRGMQLSWDVPVQRCKTLKIIDSRELNLLNLCTAGLS